MLKFYKKVMANDMMNSLETSVRAKLIYKLIWIYIELY